MSRRSRRRENEPVDSPLAHRIASILLQYPDDRVRTRLGDISAALPAVSGPAVRAHLAGVVDWLRATPDTAAAQHYVATFDHTRKRGLYLTYYRHGDTRTRGMALLTIKHTYRQAGYPPPDSELPDFLPLILEFASVAPEPGRRVLVQCQAGLELLRQGLRDHGSHYAPVLDAVCAGLPDLGPRERAELDRLATAGPPAEQVGLEPFAPPDYVAGAAR